MLSRMEKFVSSFSSYSFFLAHTIFFQYKFLSFQTLWKYQGNLYHTLLVQYTKETLGKCFAQEIFL